VFTRVAVLGTGLIGGSVCLGLRAGAMAHEVTGWDVDPGALGEALRRGAFTAGASSAPAAVSGADLVVVATPVGETVELCKAIQPALEPGAVVTDVGSAKADVVASCEGLLGSRFVGGHPMAGSERHGIAAADAELFQDAWWIVTPTATTSSRAYRAVSGLAGALGARPIAVDPVEHDRLLARLSHLPQVVASAVVAVATGAGAKESLLGLAAGGFRDVTRIAASDPALWVGILRANSEAVLEALEDLTGVLGDICTALEAGRWADLHALLAASRAARLELFGKPELHDVAVTLAITVLDRPGVLAEVTTEAGRLGANIEDLQIVHSTEGGRGRLELVVAGQEPAEALAEALGGLGYRVEWGRPE
jgi:prephenate dehydrogenase